MKIINRIIKKFDNIIQNQIADDFQRKREQLIVLLFALGTISLFMTIVNIVTHKTDLFLATTIFFVFSYISAFIGHLDKKSMKWSTLLFIIAIFSLFTYFILFGGTEGFSTIWLLLLPSCGLFAFDKRNGSIMTGALFLELLFFFYTPFGRSLIICKDYTKSFMTRFPMVYIAFWFIGFFLEYMREGTYKQLRESREKYEYISAHDQLTGLFNRLGFDEKISLAIKNHTCGKNFSLLIIDVDNFKHINDEYGHLAGDNTLICIGKTIEEYLKDKNGLGCRWGGEEFAIILFGESALEYKKYAEELRVLIGKAINESDANILNTVSIGGASSNKMDYVNAEKMFNLADKMLYEAKENGKNQVRCI